MSQAVHLISLPHTKTLRDGWTSCAYTAKVWKLAKMLTDDSTRKVYLYSSEENDAPCYEHIPLISSAERDEWFGKHDENDLERGGFSWNSTDPWWSTMNSRAIEEIRKRANKEDLLLLIAGWAQQPIAAALPMLTACEWGVGYEGICTRFRAFESYAWMHHVYGKRSEMKPCPQCKTGGIHDHFSFTNGFFYDTVIPNYFNPEDFYLGLNPENYLLYLGRLIDRKGIDIAAAISERTGIPLKVAGQGALEWGPGWIRYPEGEVRAPGLEFVGVAGVKERADLMANALVTLTPTKYIEPFGGVAVEAMMAGCPVVATDFGAFCVPMDAEILTRTGWKLQHEVIPSVDETLGYNPSTGLLDWTIISETHVFPDQITIEYRNRNWKVRTTRGHRWVTQKTGLSVPALQPFEDATTTDRVVLSSCAVDGDLPITPQEAALVGWLLTDGSLETRMVRGKKRTFKWEEDEPDFACRARIWQSKPEGIEAIRSVLSGVPHSDLERASEPNQLPRRVFTIPAIYVRQLLARTEIKHRGLEGFVLGLSQDSRQAFLQACIDAEGTKASAGSTILIAQNEGPVLDAIVMAAYLCGHRPTLSKGSVSKHSRHPHWIVALCNPVIVPTRLHIGEGRREDVWCPTTELGTWTMRFDGHVVVTGNTETVKPGVSGYRFHTLQEGADAVLKASRLDRKKVQEYALQNYSLEAVAPMYNTWFDRLDGLWGPGWNA